MSANKLLNYFSLLQTSVKRFDGRRRRRRLWRRRKKEGEKEEGNKKKKEKEKEKEKEDLGLRTYLFRAHKRAAARTSSHTMRYI